METSIFKEFATLFASITAVVGGLLGILKYFQYRTRRDKIMLVRQAFDTVVKSLASNVEVERLAGAILLRRFFDRETEVGIAGTPYWKEGVDVTAAILRGQPAGNFQKLLADGLGFAPTLDRADLQKTNLQFAYLGSRKKGDNPPEEVITDLRYADFYRADLSGASLKRANARGAVFYQARLQNTVFSGADLQQANFFEADLRGANFQNALLDGASFLCARNIPATLASKLDERWVYNDKNPFQQPSRTGESTPRVFISKPGCLDLRQRELLVALQAKLAEEGLVPQVLERIDYPQFGAIGEVQRMMNDCSGAVIFGFKQLEIRDGLWRSGTPEEKQLKNSYHSTPWNQIEAGMAVTLGLPIFLLCQQGVEGGVFDVATTEHQVYHVFAEADWTTPAVLNLFTSWCADVRERNRSR